MTSVLDRVADHLEEQANPPFLAKIKDWRESDCADPTRLPTPDLAPHWIGEGPCGSCAHCRPEQRIPEWAWDVWLYLAGRGAGKTRSAAEVVAALLALNRRWRIALVAPTYADARDTMVEGESGLISVFDRWGWIEGEDYIWNRSLGELVVRSTRSRVKLYSGEKPARLRGPQHHFAWVDELAQVVRKAPDAWDMLRFGLRLGHHPRAICTTTPLPLQLLRDMIDDPRVAVARGRTDDNKANLPAVTLQAFHDKYDGTALGAQELDGDLIDHMPGALWQLAWIARNRIKVTATADWAKDPQETTQAAARAIVAELAEQGITLTRIVIGVDPAVTSGEEADESGIIVVGRATNGRYYVLADYTIRDTPDTTVEKTLQAYDDWEANTVILEVNNGGEWIPSMVKKTCKLEKRPIIPMEIIRAKKGKRVRAEPVSGEYERNQVHHVGVHKKLEDQICTWLPESIKSPDRMDGLVYGCLYLSDHGIPSQLATASTVAGSLPRHQMLRPTTMPTTSVGSRAR